jgi:hypothetical protein
MFFLACVVWHKKYIQMVQDFVYRLYLKQQLDLNTCTENWFSYFSHLFVQVKTYSKTVEAKV